MSGLETPNSTPPGGDTGLFPWWDTFTFEEAEEDLMNNWDASDTIVRQLDSWFHPHATGRRRHTEQREQMVCRRRNLLCNTCEGTPEEHVTDAFLRCNAPGLNKIFLCFTYFIWPGWGMIARCFTLTFTGCLRAQHGHSQGVSTSTCWRLHQPIIYLWWEEIHPEQTYGSSCREAIGFCSLDLTRALQVCPNDWQLCSGWCLWEFKNKSVLFTQLWRKPK